MEKFRRVNLKRREWVVEMTMVTFIQVFLVDGGCHHNV